MGAFRVLAVSTDHLNDEATLHHVRSVLDHHIAPFDGRVPLTSVSYAAPKDRKQRLNKCYDISQAAQG